MTVEDWARWYFLILLLQQRMRFARASQAARLYGKAKRLIFSEFTRMARAPDIALARFARWQKMSLELYRKTFKHNNVVKLFIIALVKVVTCNIIVFANEVYARTGLREARGEDGR